MRYLKFHREFQAKRHKAIVTVQKHLRGYLFWKRDVVKNMRVEKLERNNRYWQNVKVGVWSLVIE